MIDTLDNFALGELAALDVAHTRRKLVETRRDGVFVWRDGRKLLSFCCNDYLGLSQHVGIKRAAVEAIETYGVGAGASRLVTGDHPLYRGLEERLARLKGTEAAIVFGSGYLANLSIVPALMGKSDLVLIDELAHSCLFAGAALSGARMLRFNHNDVSHLAELLDKYRARAAHCLILTDHVFSMDGDRAPLSQIASLARDHDAWLLADDAHGVGVVEPPSPQDVPLQMGTLSKAIGGYGGYLCASKAVVSLLHSRARAFVYTTGLPPATIAAASAALDLITADPEWARSPLAKARLFVTQLGLPEPASQIVPLILGDAAAALNASASLEQQGFLVAAIRPPTVPKDTARLRFTFCANHTDAQILDLADAVRRSLPATFSFAAVA